MSDFSNFVVNTGELLDSVASPSPEQLAKVRQRFLSYFERGDDDTNEIDDKSDEFYHYMNKYFLTPDVLPKLIRGNSAWCNVPLADNLVTPEVIKSLISAYDNGYGGNYAAAVSEINPSRITPDIVDFIAELNKDELQDFIEDTVGLNPQVIQHAEEILSSVNESIQLMDRMKKLAGL